MLPTIQFTRYLARTHIALTINLPLNEMKKVPDCHFHHTMDQINAIMIKSRLCLLTALNGLESNQLRFCPYKRLHAVLQIYIRVKIMLLGKLLFFFGAASAAFYYNRANVRIFLCKNKFNWKLRECQRQNEDP
jgi:hypothetical protein